MRFGASVFCLFLGYFGFGKDGIPIAQVISPIGFKNVKC